MLRGLLPSRSNAPSPYDKMGGKPMTDTVRTRRLICRNPSDHDSHLLFPILSDPQAMIWFGPERVLSQEESAQWVKNHERLRSTEGFAPWVVCLEESGAVIGWGGLSRDSRDKRPVNELIYILAPSEWGRGLGTEFARASVNYGFETLGLVEIETSVRPQNPRSVAILNKIGMRLVRQDDTGRDWYRLKNSDYTGFSE
jgi:RimJ/RimL family protein N-acetyltransferase